MPQEKDKPTVETVQKAVKLSDLLIYEVCSPVKEQIDKIELCSPSIVDWKPKPKCKPGPEPVCFPDIRLPNWKINYIIEETICNPHPIPPRYDFTELITNPLPWEFLTGDISKLQTQVKDLLVEVEILKKRPR